MTDYYVVGISHIDMAFVMRQEAQEEMVDILLERVIGALERHEELHFALEQAAHYRSLKTRRPDLFQKVKALLQEGRLEFMGGMATSAETNFPDGECLVRNQGMGLLWVEENLGVRPQQGWLVDTFGLNAQVPQIMKQFGFKLLFANRFGGDKRFDLFQDEGLDGSRILVSGRDLASVNVRPDSQAFVFCRNWGDVDRLFADADKLSGNTPKLVVYYLENEEIYSEYYLKLTEERIAAGGKWKHSTYQEFCEALEKCDYEAPVIKGDLNPEFTGTFALRTPIRIENRKAETRLLDAEKWSALLGGGAKKALDNCWWDLFFCQFHDVFSGSHEDITYRNILGKFAGVCKESDTALKEALRLEEDGRSILCCNSLGWPRSEWVEIEGEAADFAVYDGENKLPVCMEEGRAYFRVDIPAGGIRQYQIREEKQETCGEQQARKEISNEYLHLVLDERDGIEKLEDHNGNCFISHAADFLVAQQDFGGLQIEMINGEEIYASSGEIRIGTVCSNAMEEKITMYGEFPKMPWNKGTNSLSWEAEFSLRRGEKALRVKLLLDWYGEGTRIRFRIPSCMEGRDVYYEIPFGVVRREAYKNLPTAKGEWPAHRFVTLENGKLGIALINKGVAGVEQEGNALTTTLIRAYGDSDNVWVKPTPVSSQHGKQTFAFMIAPYAGDYHDAGIVRLAQEFNQPVKAWKGYRTLCGGENFREDSWFEVKERNLVLSAVKEAWDGSGDLIVRVYESEGMAVRGTIRIKGIREVCMSDVKEEAGSRLPYQDDTFCVEFMPFEIKTFRITR